MENDSQKEFKKTYKLDRVKKGTLRDVVIMVVFTINGLSVSVLWNKYGTTKAFDFSVPNPTAKQELYKKAKPVKWTIPAYYENCSDIEIREFISPVNGCLFYGELNGYGRVVWSHSGVMKCPSCKSDIREVLKELKK